MSSSYLNQWSIRRDWRSIVSGIHREQIASASAPWLDKPIALTDAENKFSDGSLRRTTWREWLREKFVIHTQSRAKDGACVVLCELQDYRPGTELCPTHTDDKKPKNVRNSNIARVWAMGADIDGMQSYADATAKLKSASVAFIGYSSFNHLTKVDEAGNSVEKFRIIIPFAEPVDLTSAEERFYPAVVTDVLAHFGIALDVSCRNEARVWYYPAHAPTYAAEGRAFIDLNHIDHTPFDVMPFVEAARLALKEPPKQKAKAERKKKPKASEADAIESGASVLTPWVPRFVSLCGKDFDAQSFVLQLAGSHAQKTGTDAVDCRCSLRYEYDDHCSATEVDRKTMFVFNGGSKDSDGNSRERFFIGCNHGRCNHPSEVYLDAFVREHATTAADADALEAVALEFVSERVRKRYLENRVLPSGFWFKGRFVQTFAGGNDVIDVCSRFEINGNVRDEHGGGWGIEIAFPGHDGRLKTAVVRKEELQTADASWRARLVDQGFWIGTKARQKDAIADLFNRLVADNGIVTFSRPGWHTTDAGKFHVSVLGDVVGETDSKTVYRLRAGAGAPGLKAGTLERWKADVAAQIDKTIPHFGFCTMVAAAGALIEPIGAAPTMFYLLGPSTVGKTAAQICQASVWSNPKGSGGCLVDLNSTPNASEAILHALNGTTVAFDEVGKADPRLLKGLAFGFASGKGKERLTKNIERRAAYSWHLTGTLSGESTLADALAKHKIIVNEVAGEVVRMPTIDHSHITRTSSQKVDAIKRSACANYGHVGPAVVKALFDGGYLADADLLRNRVEARLMDLAAHETGPCRRAAHAFAIVWVAGDIMREADLLPPSFDVEYFVRWAWSCFVDFGGASKLDPIQPAIERLKTQLQTRSDVVRGAGTERPDENRLSAFAPHSTSAIRVPFSGAKAYFDGEFYYIPREFFSDFIGTTAPVASVVKKLRELGALIPQGEKNTLWTRIPGKATEGEAKMLPHYKICSKTLLSDAAAVASTDFTRLVSFPPAGGASRVPGIVSSTNLKFH